MLSLEPCAARRRSGVFSAMATQMRVDTRSGTPTLMLTIQSETEQPVANVIRQCPKWDGKPLTMDVSNTFAEGSGARFLQRQIATVSGGKITLQPALTAMACCCLSAPKPQAPRRLLA
jgi:alpha-amylase